MTETKRTAAEIRAYCEAASEGPWYAHATDDEAFMNARYVGLHPCEELRHDNRQGMSAGNNYQEVTESVIAITCLQSPRLADRAECDDNTIFMANARTDLPRVLEVAVTEHDVLKTLMQVARGISKSATTGHPLARWEIMQLDDAIMGASKVTVETAWLAEGESGEGEG